MGMYVDLNVSVKEKGKGKGCPQKEIHDKRGGVTRKRETSGRGKRKEWGKWSNDVLIYNNQAAC